MKFAVFPLGLLFAGLLLTACQDPGVVHAGGDIDYKPRSALPPPHVDEEQGMSGELLRVNLVGKTIAVRVENGMVQTFKVDGDTMVSGIEDDSDKGCKSPVRTLAGKEGSEVLVQWMDQDGLKLATSVEVEQLAATKSTRRPRRSPY